MRTGLITAALAAFAGGGLACIQVHTYYQQSSFVVGVGDNMSIQVWVNGQLVCQGGDSYYASQPETEFAVQNGDGKGSQCAPGYSYVASQRGGKGTFYYWENGKQAYSIDMHLDDSEAGSIDCFCYEGKNGAEICNKCITRESILTAHSCSNLPQMELCDGKALCDFPGLPNDEKFNPPNPFPFSPSQAQKIMVVGDSISHGAERDWTWRYRLWEWFKVQGYPVSFVGPYAGTHGPASPASALPQPALLPGESAKTFPDVTGLYADGVNPSFAASGHAAWWGRQAMQDKSQIKGWVSQYQPDYILILLGFNDLGWFVSGPDGLIDSMNTIIVQARSAKPNVKFLIGNVVDRQAIAGRQDLIDNTKTYNEDLKTAVSIWDYDYQKSPVAYVDVNSNYNCRPGSCPDGYDGLHPSALGEYHIAQAFANVLRDTFKFLGEDFQVGSPPARALGTPTGLVAQGVPEGIMTGWNEYESARGYNIRIRLQGMTNWWSSGAVYPNTFRNYFTWCGAGQTWEFAVASQGDFGALSEWSGVASAKCNPSTAPGPNNIIVTPGSNSIRFTWETLPGYSVNRYQVIVWDQDTQGAFINGFATTGTSYTVTGLIPGHRYGTWVQTWVNLPNGNVGGGPPKGAREVFPGGATPGAPSGLKVVNVNPTTVKLSWNGVANTAGYSIEFRSKINATNKGIDGTTTETSYQIGFLVPGTWNYEFCVHAYNGNSESQCTGWVTPPVYPGFSKRAEVESNLTETEMALQMAVKEVEQNKRATLWGLMQQNATGLAMK